MSPLTKTHALVIAALGAACATPSVPIAGNDMSATATTTAAGTGPVGSTGAGGGTSGTSTVGTGGGGPTGTWQNVTANLANMPSECGNLTNVFVKPDQDMLFAGVANNGLWASTDGGASWTALGSGAGSAKIVNRPSGIVYDPNSAGHFWESGIYNGGGVFETTNNGSTFTQLGNVSHCDLVSVDLADPDRKTLLAGGHEQTKTLYRSTDHGMTWTNIGSGLPDGTFCTLPLVIDALTYVVGCGGFGSGPNGLQRTEDGGKTWTQVSMSGGGSAPLQASDGSIYWPSFGGGLTQSTDKGRTWTDKVHGVISSARVVELPDGRLAALAGKVVVTSSDQGSTWTQVSSPVPFANNAAPVGIEYSADRKAFYAWYFTCSFGGDTGVPADAVQRYAFDYQMQ